MEAERRRQVHVWMVRFAEGDRDAFQPLFDALWPVLLALSCKALDDASDAEDAAQQALLKIFSRIADFDPERDGLSWAMGIAGFEALTLRKQRVRRREAGPAALDSLVAGGAGLEDRASSEQLLRLVSSLIGELSPADRKALTQTFWLEEVPTTEAGRKRRYRALERLRALWRRVYG